jgi:rhodanese-related sulfurtransferase
VRSSVSRQIFLLLGLALLPGIGQALYFHDRISWQSPVPSGDLVSVVQAEAWGINALWIDARPDEEFARDHFPNALQLNEDRWNELLPHVVAGWSPEKKVVVYCGSQSCGSSRAVAQRLRDEAQIKGVFVLEGGWEALRAAGK